MAANLQVISSHLTPKQNELLISAGFKSLYSLIIYFPYRLSILHEVKSLDDIPLASSEEFRLVLTLTDITKRFSGGRMFLTLSWTDVNGRLIQTYLFSVARYTMASLTTGDNYTAVIKKQKDFWSLVKYTKTSTTNTTNIQSNDSLETHYIKRGLVNNTLFRSIFRRLKPEDYVLNVAGLYPVNVLLPQSIDLRSIHFPTNQKSYDNTKNVWQLIQAYLFIALNSYYVEHKPMRLAKASVKNSSFVNQIIDVLPYKLSLSQRDTINAIIQDITV